MRLAICFTNFGPYHLARLRALGTALRTRGDELIAYEITGAESRYPWRVERGDVPFRWITFFPERTLERLPASVCRAAMRAALDRDSPDAVAIVGYARPECVTALRWSRRHRRPAVLMSESQRIDHPRTWWKEEVKSQRVRRFDAALVGGPAHRDYLIDLGLPQDRIVLGYNAVDNHWYEAASAARRRDPAAREKVCARPYLLAVSRFVPEKNLDGLVRAYAAYRSSLAASEQPWDLVLCGGHPPRAFEALIASLGVADSVHCPGFLQAEQLIDWYAFASAFVHPSRMEPWGLAVNEAAACGLPILVSARAGCAETLVPDPPGTTGRRFDPFDHEELIAAMLWMARLSAGDREAMGKRALRAVGEWGPDRFASGTLEALRIAQSASVRRHVLEFVP